MLLKTHGMLMNEVAAGNMVFSSKEAACRFRDRVLETFRIYEKTAAEATANQEEVAVVGEALTDKDLESLQKILTLLHNLYAMRQNAQGGGGPGQAIATQAAANGMQQAAAAPPPASPAGPPVDPNMMGGMPPGMPHGM